MRNLSINGQRLWDTLMETAAIGAAGETGLCRLSLSAEDRRVRAWLRDQCEAAGCRVMVDEVGNMFAIKPGQRRDVAPIAMGSHLDTQPSGGRFDGVLGVLAALEVVRTLDELGYVTQAPLMIVNWTNEEGARFPQAMLGSGVYAGVFSAAQAGQVTDRDGVTVAQALADLALEAPVPAGSVPFQALFELHIEQGPVLEAEGVDIGVVTGVQAMRWIEISVRGQESHTGTTPMHARHDALLGAARMIAAVQALGCAYAPGVASVGFIENTPNTRNVVAGRTIFTVDMRHPEDAVLDSMERDLTRLLPAIAQDLRLEVTMQVVWRSGAVHFDAGMIQHVRDAARLAGVTARDIVSGAGHDAAFIARRVPATMIFAPSAGGVSHHPSEFTGQPHCATACQVLLQAVLLRDEASAAAWGG